MQQESLNTRVDSMLATATSENKQKDCVGRYGTSVYMCLRTTGALVKKYQNYNYNNEWKCRRCWWSMECNAYAYA